VDGGLDEAELTESWTGTSAAAVRGYYEGTSEAEQAERVTRDLQERFPGAVVDSYRAEGLDIYDEPVRETVRFRGGRLGQRLGDLLIVEPGSVGYGIIGTNLPPPPRTHPLDLGHPREETLEVVIEIAEGWRPEALPDAVEVSGGELEFRSRWEFDRGRLSYLRAARLLDERVTPERYAAFREAQLALQAADRTAVVHVAVSGTGETEK
jgi:hypothetical protein